ncbi:MAG: 16S rRNA (cytosine(967)-C(5))-methyltransferase RsmB [Pseudomonadota bacterium]
MTRSSNPPRRRPSSSLPPADSLAFALLAAAEVIGQVIAGSNLNDSLARCWQARGELPPATRGAIQDLSYGSLRDYGRGDFLLQRLMHKPVPELRVRALLLAALHRLAVRPQDAHTTVDQAVAAARTLAGGAFAGLVNAVLRNSLRQGAALEPTERDEQAFWRHPRWWIERLRAAYPQDWAAILAAGNGHPPMALRVNRRKITRQAYLARLLEQGIDARPLPQADALLLAQPLPVARLPGFAEGLVSVQDPGAQQAAAWLDLADGQRVLDACAAPGGKTCHMLESAEVDLLALDADAGRAQRIHDNLTRLDLHARVAVADARALESWWDGRPFERILADLPCSASGVVRRHPDIKWLRRSRDIPQFARQQAEILAALWRVLAPGGKLLYATCSLFPEENGLNVADFAARQPDCLRLPLEGKPEIQLLPTDTHDGFFYALLQKRA